MIKKRVFPGLRIDDFIHNEDQKFYSNDKDSASLVEKGLELLNDASVLLAREVTLGRYVEVTEHNCPRLVNILKNVCKILDFNQMPGIYLHHEAEQYTLALGSNRLHILVSEYALECYDDDMLYFILGNAVTMFKGGHTTLNTICNLSGGLKIAYPVKLVLLKKLRAADLTSDRGGLLACQSFDAAARCILMSMGYPHSDLIRLNTDELTNVVEAVIHNEEQTDYGGLLGDAAVSLIRVNMISSPAGIKLKELYDWYRTGYKTLYESGRESYEWD